MARKIDPSPEELAGLVQEVLARLARDPAASHLWHWRPRPGCPDEPPGSSRRNHLATLLGMLGAATLPAACGSSSASDSTNPRDVGTEPFCAEDPYNPPHDMIVPPDAGRDMAPPDAHRPDAPPPDIAICGDDPCACGDDPCACADDPCACADDPCGGG